MNDMYCPKCNQNAGGIYSRDDIPYSLLKERIPGYQVDAIKEYVDNHDNGQDYFVCSACAYVEEV